MLLPSFKRCQCTAQSKATLLVSIAGNLTLLVFVAGHLTLWVFVAGHLTLLVFVAGHLTLLVFVAGLLALLILIGLSKRRPPGDPFGMPPARWPLGSKSGVVCHSHFCD